MRRFDRVLAFSGEEGWIEAEAGISLGQLFDFLVPRGFSIGVQPGHPQITLGGCIGGNVHGKNHYREGAFAQQVLSLRLFHPLHGLMNLGPDNDPGLFELTCGGFGLTGIIVSARVRIHPIEGNTMICERHPVGSLRETFRLLDEMKDRYDLVYSWNDLTRFDGRLGRGHVVTAKFARLPDPPRENRFIPIRLDPSGSRLRLPLLNDMTLPWVNAAYHHMTRADRSFPIGIFNAFFPWVSKGLYFDSFGAAGVLEPQLLVSMEAASDYCDEFETTVRKHGQPFAIASFKIFRGRQKLLRFDGSGISFSIQIPNTARSRELCADIDQLNVRYGAITNLIKDSRLPPEIARQLYPEFETFAARLRAFDPRRLFRTALSERLGL